MGVILLGLKQVEVTGTRGVVVKCVDITRNTKGEGKLLGLFWRWGTKARGAKQIRDLRSPSPKRILARCPALKAQKHFEKNLKSQAPMTKQIWNSNIQIQNNKNLEFCIWILFGICDLEFGISQKAFAFWEWGVVS